MLGGISESEMMVAGVCLPGRARIRIPVATDRRIIARFVRHDVVGHSFVLRTTQVNTEFVLFTNQLTCKFQCECI